MLAFPIASSGGTAGPADKTLNQGTRWDLLEGARERKGAPLVEGKEALAGGLRVPRLQCLPGVRLLTALGLVPALTSRFPQSRVQLGHQYYGVEAAGQRQACQST